MRELPDGCVDAIVTDPPYGLSFMGKKWDYDVPSTEIWAECLRVLKPGGHLLAFAGTRTQHRMAVRIEDAGFEIRDMIAWVYGSGFPKSHNLDGERQGWGTALKPALEPITVARKPLIGTVAANVLAYGTGALNIDGCRVGVEERTYAPKGTSSNAAMIRVPEHRQGQAGDNVTVQGRWPANLIHDGSQLVLDLFPETKSGNLSPHHKLKASDNRSMSGGNQERSPRTEFGGDTGSAARFFYCAKTSKKDRDEGLDGVEEKQMGFSNGAQIHGEGYDKAQSIGLNRVISRKNNHPTVKPTDLMRYLCRLVTPPGGTVLDPFMGSGSTGKAAKREGFGFIGIERDEAYFDIAKRRIDNG
jgi:site-specific DNA-methyltransferase (adenine-specific)